MAFSDMMRNRRVLVDGTPVMVPENALASEIIEASGQDPKSRDLVRYEPGDGTVEVFPGNRRVRPKEGENFEAQITSINGN